MSAARPGSASSPERVCAGSRGLGIEHNSSTGRGLLHPFELKNLSVLSDTPHLVPLHRHGGLGVAPLTLNLTPQIDFVLLDKHVSDGRRLGASLLAGRDSHFPVRLELEKDCCFAFL